MAQRRVFTGSEKRHWVCSSLCSSNPFCQFSPTLHKELMSIVASCTMSWHSNQLKPCSSWSSVTLNTKKFNVKLLSNHLTSEVWSSDLQSFSCVSLCLTEPFASQQNKQSPCNNQLFVKRLCTQRELLHLGSLASRVCRCLWDSYSCRHWTTHALNCMRTTGFQKFLRSGM